jgi:steroid delta-isomerase-like uncharacterized protein
MSEQNKQIARRFADAFSTGDTTILEEVVAEDLADPHPAPGQRPGRQAVIDAVGMLRAGFPDLAVTIEREVAAGDIVVQYGAITGTHTGELMGRPATGKRATFAYMDMHRIVNGRIVEICHVEDFAGMLRQLGLT